jgi:hypothetical protein
MTKVCILGDSHTGALLSGWRAMKSEFPEIEITSFGAPRALFGELVVSGSQLVPNSEKLSEYFRRTSGGLEAVSHSYDRYIVCGLSWAMRFLLPTIVNFRSEDQVRNGRIPLSNDCYARVMAGLLRESISVQTLAKLRQITDCPITMIAAPMPSDRSPMQMYTRLSDSGDALKIARQFELSAGVVAKEAGAEFLGQPSETLSNPLQTLYRFKRGSVRAFDGKLDVEHGEDDHQHMNAEYGELVLRAAFLAERSRFDDFL